MLAYIGYGILAAVLFAYLRRFFMFRAVVKNLPNFLKEGALIVDVRSPEEFSNGNVKGSVNIPLQEIHYKADGLKKEQTILVCCVSGNRSGMATNILKGKGFKNVINAGPWVNLA
jgi:phage shock protein E